MLVELVTDVLTLDGCYFLTSHLLEFSHVLMLDA